MDNCGRVMLSDMHSHTLPPDRRQEAHAALNAARVAQKTELKRMQTTAREVLNEAKERNADKEEISELKRELILARFVSLSFILCCCAIVGF